jgi:hypothetical protein
VYRGLRLTGELLALLDTFDRHEVEAIPFKGPVLALQLYADVAARYYGDLDFLVRERQFDKALSLLRARGYEPVPEFRRSPSLRWLRSDGQCRVLRDGDAVELHCALGPPGFPIPLDFDGLWSRLESLCVGGRIVRAMSGDDLVLYLAAHGAKHMWERRDWISDFAQLVRTSPELDWDRIAAAAGAHGAERMLLLALRLARDMLGVLPPPALAAGVDGDRRVSALARDVRRRLSDASPSFAEQPWPLRVFQLRAIERVRDRARLACSVFFTPGPAEWAMLRLPRPLSWLYYVVRLIRVAVTGSMELLRGFIAGVPRLWASYAPLQGHGTSGEAAGEEEPKAPDPRPAG